MEDRLNDVKVWCLQQKKKLQQIIKQPVGGKASSSAFIDVWFQQYVSVLSSSWLSSIAFQRVAGVLTIHSGRPGYVQVPAGGVGMSVAVITSLMINQAFENKNRHDDFSIDNFLLTLDKQSIRNLYMSIGCYIFLEQLPFPFVLPLATALPSSLLDKGVFARAGGGSIEATAVAATSSERQATQRIGKWRGCHHCGGRVRQLVRPRGAMLVGGMGYIADHMPPTKIAKEHSDAWWRKLLGITVKQRLYPQCQPCFSQQGEAVRSGKHVLIYHYGMRPCHFATVLALFLCTTPHRYRREVDHNCTLFEDTVVKSYQSMSQWFTWY